MKKLHLHIVLLLLICLSSCQHDSLNNVDIASINALIVKPAGTRTNYLIHTDDGLLIYPIGSAFQGGSDISPSISGNRIHFYQEKFTTCPKWNEVEAIVEISGFEYVDVHYSELSQTINRIYINGLDEMLGLGTNLVIPMNQGKYEGGNDLIQDVQIQSYKLATYINKNGDQNRDADIRILITSKAGDELLIRFMNDVTPGDGYI